MTVFLHMTADILASSYKKYGSFNENLERNRCLVAVVVSLVLLIDVSAVRNIRIVEIRRCYVVMFWYCVQLLSSVLVSNCKHALNIVQFNITIIICS